MKTIKFFTLLLAGGILMTACGKTSSEKSEDNQKDSTAVSEAVKTPEIKTLEAKTLNGYFLKNSKKVENKVEVYQLSDQKTFGEYLGVSKTTNNQIDKPDFNNIVVAMASKPVQSKAELSVTKTEEVDGKEINVYVDLKEGEPVTFSMQPLLVVSIPKSKDVKVINFIYNNETVKSFMLNRPVAEIPKSMNELKSDYTGTFSGVLPCADCPGIETKLTLNADNTYKLEMVYQERGDGKPFIETGKWTPSKDLSTVELNNDKGGEKNSYAWINKTTLEQLDMEGNPIVSELNYRLVKAK